MSAAPPPHYRIVSARVSPVVELARWLFERYGIAYLEEAHAPILHVLATRRAGGGVEVPVVVVRDGGIWDGGPAVVAHLDALSPPGRKLLGETPAEHDSNARLVAALFDHLLRPVRRYVYHLVLPDKAAIVPVATEAAPLWESLFVRWLYPLWRLLMARGLDFSPAALAEAPGRIREAFTLVEAELDKGGSPFLAGSTPGGVDIVFAALVAPVLFPLEYGAKLPPFDGLPAELRAFITECRERRAGKLALETYARARHLSL